MKQASLVPKLLDGFSNGTSVEIPSLEILAQLLRDSKMKQQLQKSKLFFDYANQQILNSVKKNLTAIDSDVARGKLEKMYDLQKLYGTKETEIITFELIVVHFPNTLSNDLLLTMIHDTSGQYSKKEIALAQTAFSMR